MSSSSAASPAQNTSHAAGQSAVTIFQGLSLFRILLGGLLLFNFVFNYMPYFADFFSDGGFYTQAMNAKMRPTISNFSVLQWSNAAWYLMLFQAVYIPTLVLFTVGYRTKIMKWVVFAGLMAINARNPMIGYGADALMRLLFLWSLFLPLNRYWSMDSALSRAPRDEPIPAVFVAGIKLQVCMLYLFGSFFKLMGKPWLEGNAINYAMHDGVQGTPFGFRSSSCFRWDCFLISVFFICHCLSPTTGSTRF
ncbi:MAG: HTTM domain-containing protein [Proteobacteria bacterium]|nr:HTTM domain-containing protein [Pseudomonadota bacterium]